MNNFARSGYRTLCFAYVNISESFYEKWKDEYRKASTVLQNRDTAISIVADKIEKKLKLIGVTAIENKLQDNVYRFVLLIILIYISLKCFSQTTLYFCTHQLIFFKYYFSRYFIHFLFYNKLCEIVNFTCFNYPP